MTILARRAVLSLIVPAMLTAVGLTLFVSATPLLAAGPDDPEVLDAIENGIAYLEDNTDERLGGKALVGLTFAKYGAKPDHPRIRQGIDALKNALRSGGENFRADIYTTGISIMFLVAVDPSQYRPEIEALVKSLHLRQKEPGAWGYPASHEAHGKSCDTSMTQYAVLGLWEAADQAGVETPPETWDRVAKWLIQTQASEGGFGYQGNPSGNYERKAKQTGVRDSMTVAALGSLYITRNQLGHGELKKREDDDTPAALQPYESQEERAARIKTKIDLRYFYRTINAGNRWMDAHYKPEPSGWIHYYLYTLERYQSLREADERLPGSGRRTPKWYTDGSRYLIDTQRDDGSWESKCTAVPDTCFSVLFLLRSTRKSLERSSVARFGAGVLDGGRGLPVADSVRLRDGKVVVAPLEAPTEEVIAIVADPEHEKYAQARESLADLSQADPAELNRHAQSLARLAVTGRGEVRVLAIRALTRSRDLDQAPLFIYLLEDADLDVVIAARDGLRTISRNFDGFGLGRQPTAVERQRAVEKWKQWFASVRPDVDLAAYEPPTDAP